MLHRHPKQVTGTRWNTLQEPFGVRCEDPSKHFTGTRIFRYWLSQGVAKEQKVLDITWEGRRQKSTFSDPFWNSELLTSCEGPLEEGKIIYIAHGSISLQNCLSHQRILLVQLLNGAFAFLVLHHQVRYQPPPLLTGRVHTFDFL